MKKIFIDELKSGTTVSDFYAVSTCEKRLTKANKYFITAKIMDCTGEINAIAWDNAETLEKVLIPNAIVKINAIVESYDGNIQLKILDAKELTSHDKINIADFKKASNFNLDDMQKQLFEFINSIENEDLKALLNYFFENQEYIEKFKSFPAAKSMHHAYVGGLIEHTLSTARSADLLCKNYKEVNRDLLITGVLLHDFAKIFEFNNDIVVEYSLHGSLVGHIVMGSELVARATETLPNFPDKLKWQIQHLLLSHHGEPEFGAAVVPVTLEAILLSTIDRLDAHIFQITNAIKNEQDKSGDFTQKIYGLERRFLKSNFDENLINTQENGNISPEQINQLKEKLSSKNIKAEDNNTNGDLFK